MRFKTTPMATGGNPPEHPESIEILVSDNDDDELFDDPNVMENISTNQSSSSTAPDSTSSTTSNTKSLAAAQQYRSNSSSSSQILYGGFDFRKYQPFYYSESRPSVSTKILEWDGPPPFEDNESDDSTPEIIVSDHDHDVEPDVGTTVATNSTIHDATISASTIKPPMPSITVEQSIKPPPSSTTASSTTPATIPVIASTSTTIENDGPSTSTKPIIAGNVAEASTSNDPMVKKRRRSWSSSSGGENDDSDPEDDDDNVFTRPRKSRMVAIASDDDEEEAIADDNEPSTSSILSVRIKSAKRALRLGLVKPCEVQLERIPEKQFREALKNSPRAKKHLESLRKKNSSSTDSLFEMEEIIERGNVRAMSPEQDRRKITDEAKRRKAIRTLFEPSEPSHPDGRGSRSPNFESTVRRKSESDQEDQRTKDRPPRERPPPSSSNNGPRLVQSSASSSTTVRGDRPSTTSTSSSVRPHRPSTTVPRAVSVNLGETASTSYAKRPSKEPPPMASAQSSNAQFNHRPSAAVRGSPQSTTMPHAGNFVKKSRSHSASTLADRGVDDYRPKKRRRRRSKALGPDEAMNQLQSNNHRSDRYYEDRQRSVTDQLSKARQQLRDRMAKTVQMKGSNGAMAQGTSTAAVKKSSSTGETSASDGGFRRIPKLSPSKQRKHPSVPSYISPLGGMFEDISSDDQATTSSSAVRAAPYGAKAWKPASVARNYKPSSMSPHLRRSSQNSSTSSTKESASPITIPKRSILKQLPSPVVAQRNDSQDRRLVIDDPPRKRKKVTFNDKLQIREFEPVQRQCDRAFSPVHGGTGDNSFGTVEFLSIEDEIVAMFLKWNPDWLREANQNWILLNGAGIIDPPPIIEYEYDLRKVQSSYESLRDYFDTYKVLLLHEIWENLFFEYRRGEWAKYEPIECRVVHAHHNGQTFKNFSVVAIINKDVVEHFRPNALLTFHLADRRLHDESQQQQQHQPFFGLITRSSWSSVRRLDEIRPELKKCTNLAEDNVKQFCSVHMTIRSRWKTNMPTYDTGAMVVQILSDLSPMMHLVSALANLGRNKEIGNLTLDPKSIFENDGGRRITAGDLRISRKGSYSDDQLTVVSSCMNALDAKDKPIVRLISGPTASGKTQSIVGFIEEVQLMKLRQNDDDTHRLSQRSVILVLAPSSEKTDDVSRKILELNNQYKSKSSRNHRLVNFMRMGSRESMAPDVARYSIETLIENHIKQEEASAAPAPDEGRDAMQQRKAYLKGQLSSYLASQPTEADIEMQIQYQLELDELERRLGGYVKSKRSQHHSTEVAPPEPNTSSYLKEHLKKWNEQKERYLTHADVVAFSLDKCGDDLEMLKSLAATRKISILCTIVDDASNTCELQTLFAAFQNFTKLFLFGDEEPKVPNVLSKIAYENGFGNSLFSRILSNVDSDTPVLRLKNSRSANGGK